MPPPLAPIPRRLPLEPPRRRFNRTAVYLAVAIAAATLPFTLHYQQKRVGVMNTPPPSNFATANSQGPLPELYNLTDKQATARFGAPVETHDYPLNVGSFAGPYNGLKHYYRFTDPDYEKHMQGAETTWTFPQYSVIREMIWRQQDSYLTVWLHEPRAEVELGADDAEVTLPSTGSGEWVALDNYRVGKGLLKAEPTFPPVRVKSPAATP